ncbi:Hypothetical protein A7982_10843 [Minicystis rosea]|nr:Hypothetical protein A7982_10843 [Minicystis rosea]
MRKSQRAKRLELFEVLTVGLPFCGFKILAGALLVGRSEVASARLFGTALVCLGVLDALINGVNLVGLVAQGRRLLAACSFSLLLSTWRRPPASAQRWRDLGDALDVLFSFVLVAVMIGAGQLRALPPERLAVWNVCVILNVLGAGLGRFGEAWENLRRDADGADELTR